MEGSDFNMIFANHLMVKNFTKKSTTDFWGIIFISNHQYFLVPHPIKMSLYRFLPSTHLVSWFLEMIILGNSLGQNWI